MLIFVRGLSTDIEVSETSTCCELLCVWEVRKQSFCNPQYTESFRLKTLGDRVLVQEDAFCGVFSRYHFSVDTQAL